MTILFDTSHHSLTCAREILVAGGLVAFPTETVYGLGANGLNSHAVKKIFEAKGRPQDNPLILHISDIGQFDTYAESIPDYARKLIDIFCPGPITFVFQKKSIVPDIVTAGLPTVCLRIPNNRTTLDLIDMLDFPLAGPSANRSGRPSPTSAMHVMEDLDGRIDAVIDGSETQIGIESTVLDCTGETPYILRQGSVTHEMIEDILGYRLVHTSGQEKKSPGTRYRHYAPDLPIVISEREERESLLERISGGESIAIMYLTTDSYDTIFRENIFSFTTLEDISHALFRIFRECEKRGYTTLYIERLPLSGIGSALMNRIDKASTKI